MIELDKNTDSIMLRFNDTIGTLIKQFADKTETKKLIKMLERQIKNLYDLIMSKNGDKEDDGLFSTKHLCGFNCAACSKNLVNLYG